VKTWLFTRSDQSIYVLRSEGRELVIYGPGSARQRQEFADEEALQSYQMSLAERFADTGWILYGVDRQRRVGERRRQARETADRRLR
jgi:hypothetical protein